MGPGNRDVIKDFNVAFDGIDLRQIDANANANANAAGDQAFSLIGDAAFGGVAGQMRAAVDSTGNMVLRMGVDGDRFSDMNIELQGTPNLSTGNFLL